MERKLTRREMLSYAGNISQLTGARRMVIGDGLAGGMRVVEVNNGAGLQFTALEDKCLDIYDLSYKGINLAYKCKNGLVHGERYSPDMSEFMKLFTGGALFTCGMMSIAHETESDGTVFPKHGILQHRQAEQTYVKQGFCGNEYVIELGGKVTESRVLGYHLELNRRIEAKYFENSVTIRDRIDNLDEKEEGIMMVYHMNLGYPFVEEGTRVIFPAGTKITPITPNCVLDETHAVMPVPESGGEEILSMAELPPDSSGMNRVLVVNDSLELGVLVESNQDALPYVCFWKCPHAGDYVIGIEPITSNGGSRAGARENGTLAMIPGYWSKEFIFRFSILEGDAVKVCEETLK